MGRTKTRGKTKTLTLGEFFAETQIGRSSGLLGARLARASELGLNLHDEATWLLEMLVEHLKLQYPPEGLRALLHSLPVCPSVLALRRLTRLIGTSPFRPSPPSNPPKLPPLLHATGQATSRAMASQGPFGNGAGVAGAAGGAAA